MIEDDIMNCTLQNGVIKKIGYTTLNEFISLLRKQNKHLKKIGCKVTFTITLPIQEK